MPIRSSARNISASIANLAASDLLNSDDENQMDIDADVDVTLVQSDDEDHDGKSGAGDEQEDEEEEEASEDEEDDSEDGDEVEEDKEGDKDEEEEEEEVVVGMKRKRKASAKKSDKPSPSEIEYKVCMFTAKQMKKAKSSRGHPITEILNLSSDKPWSTLESNILIKIQLALQPSVLRFSDYSITFTVPRKVTEPMLLNDTKYEYLIKKALLIKNNPNVKIIVEPKEATNKENEDSSDDDKDGTSAKGKKGKKRSTKVPKARDILPANVALNAKIGELREKWICPTPGGPCGSAHCFFTETQPEHFPLSHDHFQSWAAAALKGKAFADLATPPNNELFDQVARGARAAQSPLLKRRLELHEQAVRKSTPVAPQVHVNFPPEFANLFRPPPPAPPVAAPNAFIAPPNSANMLIPHPRVAGPDLSLEDFCSIYHVDMDICNRFKEQRFKRTTAFKFVELGDLKDMGFLKGEIAELKVAIEEWSRMPDGPQES
ncbi:hypothetical protein MVEN_01819200 [Mycena venus]|uniref:Uncharacterized protein n=1 Tax=Mycena venus TaxID=2733690 RepID=A0A8H6XJE9_9AGAR|nr:hypothetical protein MVEN_01819200 [Mycena venus]